MTNDGFDEDQRKRRPWLFEQFGRIVYIRPLLRLIFRVAYPSAPIRWHNRLALAVLRLTSDTPGIGRYRHR